jgi:hypothetical protein
VALSLSTTLRNARADAVTTAIGSAGLLRIYNGTPPATVGTALSGNTKLAECVCGSPFAAAASGGVLTANAIAQENSADATGTASFYRVYKSDGTTAVIQGSVGTSGADLNLNTVSLVAGGPVLISSFAYTEPNT